MLLKKAAKNREELREKGQFWTPSWVAKAMIAYVASPSETILDLGVGAGAFYDALLTYKKNANSYRYLGIDIDEELLRELNNRKASTNHIFEKRDYILEKITKKYGAIISNPPYIRHHRLSSEVKEELSNISRNLIGKKIDGRAGIHVYFLLLALSNLKKGGKLAFIMPADTCEGVFAHDLWMYITSNFCLETVITFSPSATPFPGVDTNAIIFCISNNPPKKDIKKIHCNKLSENGLTEAIKSKSSLSNDECTVTTVDLDKAIKVGLSRDISKFRKHLYNLKDFAKVMRGIATGQNDFFFMTDAKRKELGLDIKYFTRAIGRTRDATVEVITQKVLDELDKDGRPTYLLSLDNKQMSELSPQMQKYLQYGEKIGLNLKALISQRKPWYKMETRITPPFLFAYLGRRNVRFIKNNCSAVPLTSFLCVYPQQSNKEYIEKLWKILNHPDTLSNLKFAGKSYGSGAIKVEPRSLETLAIPDHIIRQYALIPDKQLPLNEID